MSRSIKVNYPEALFLSHAIVSTMKQHGELLTQDWPLVDFDYLIGQVQDACEKMSRPNMECGECSYWLAYAEPETTHEQNLAILDHCHNHCEYFLEEEDD